MFHLLITNTMEISKSELFNVLMSVDSTPFVYLVMETPVRMNKTGNPYFDKVIKRSKCNYLIGNNYEDRVITHYTKEGLEQTFESEEMKGKEHISKCVLKSTNPDKPTTYYLMVERFDEIKPNDEQIVLLNMFLDIFQLVYQ